MSESETPSRASAEESRPLRAPSPWPARCALLAFAGLVVGGVAYGAVEVASALSPPEPAASPEGADTPAGGSDGSGRRTVSLLPEPEEEPVSAAEDGGSSAQGADASGGAAGTGDTGSAAGGGSGQSGGASSEDGADPRGEILHELLNSPQPRPPLEPLVSQEEVDAEREAIEAQVEPRVAE
ncbi:MULTISPECIES: hypothetical protein [unclassified Nocardiopsis]|uniref:hypothetical protein n=1 Tax=unclassified Nocardiopsis TaxID=2649073 RepID=UPI001359F9D7|nr:MULTISPECIES: hypothetical protein [unclassified Nocardiopsis]